MALGYNATSTSLCLTPACLHVSSDILWSLAPTWQEMDPCKEFDQMVCRGFREQYDQDKDTSAIMGDHSLRILRTVLESQYPQAVNFTAVQARSSSVDEDNFTSLQRDYEACMNESAIQNVGIAPLAQIIDNMARIWPVELDTKAPLTPADYDSLLKVLIYLEHFGVPTFQDISIDGNTTKPDTNIITLNLPKPTLKNVKSYDDPSQLQTYHGTIRLIFGKLLNLTEADAIGAATNIVNFELGILKAAKHEGNKLPSNDDEGQQEDTQDEPAHTAVLPLAVATKLAPPLSLDRFLASLAPAGYKLDQVVVTDPYYLGNVSDVINTTPKQTIQAWLAWRMITNLAETLKDPILSSWNAESDEPRWKTCVKQADTHFKWILGRFYVSANFNETTRAAGDSMMNSIRTEFNQRIGQLSWMSAESKNLAIQKVNNIKQYIGYPTSSPNIKDPQSLAAYYNGLHVGDDNFANVLSYRLWASQAKWSALGQPIDPGAFASDAGMSLWQANAYYTSSGNTITIMAGQMQLPAFSVDLPLYANYGGLGWVLGHELTHGFDNQGRLYNQDGIPASWWDANTTAAFEARAQCFVDQYSAMRIPTTTGPQPVDGKLTLAENIADAGGLNVAYGAWKTALQKGGKPEPDLPGLGAFTHEQLFYIFFGMEWCRSNGPGGSVEDLTDVHAPNAARILGATANSAKFREAFKCPVKEPTCELW